MLPQKIKDDLNEHGRKSKNGRMLNLLPSEHLEQVRAWGGASKAMSYVYRPSTITGLKKVLQIGHESGRSIVLRGAGNSYGDATLNSEQITLDTRRLKRILDWDPVIGRIRVEAGVTINQLWQYVLEDGWWPAVVPGTSKPTIGGCAGMNVHGKNAWKAGTIGDHIRDFEMLLPDGRIVSCSRENDEDLFKAAIGGFGMLGILTSITLQLKRIHSGLLNVEALVSRNLAEMFDQFEEHLDESDYLVGWIDALAKGRALGRGQIHRANYLRPGEDAIPQQTLRLENQHLSDTMFGIIPRSKMWRFMRPFFNDFGARLVNSGKYWSSRFTDGARFRQSHVAFHFLLDYVPNWKKSYGRGGLIQYQCFVPKQNALEAFSDLLRLGQENNMPNYLSVFKRHRPDDFLISHGVDGYSLAMDFRVTPRRSSKLVDLTREMDEIVLAAGGRFYLAKDSTLQPETVRAYLGQDTISEFRRLKAHYDPEMLLQSNMWRRLFIE